MSTRLLLPCSPPPHKTSPADRPVAPLSRAPPLISLGSFSSYTACQGPAKAPLLKSRRPSPQPLVLPNSPSENSISFTPPGVGLHFREVTAPFSRHLSPTREVLLPLESSPAREVTPPSRLYPEETFLLREIYHPPRKSFLSSHPKVAPNKTFSESSSSPSPLSPLSPASPSVPTFPCRLPSPSTPAPRALLKKSQSALIMPSLLTLLRPEPVPVASPLRETNPSSKSLNNSSSAFPSPLIRKCHTMVSLSASSASGGAAHQPSSTTTTKVVKDKRSGARFGFFRRISSSKSAVFSPSTSSSKTSVLRKSPSAALHRYRKGSSVGMQPHPEHPDETRPVVCEDDDEEVNHFQQEEEARTRTSGEREVSPVHDEERVAWGAISGCSRCTSVASLPSGRQSIVINDTVFCKLCLTDVSIREMYQLQQCQCRFCTYCMSMYVTLKIREGEPAIECPDSNCDCRGEMTLEEVESLVGKELLNLHLRFRRDREIEADPLKTWCPKPSCDTVVCLSVSKLDGKPQCCSCPTCSTLFCGSCSSPWHPGRPCNHIVAQLLGVPLNDSIKRCPRCKVPIERDAGCAQMQCKKCKHVFCWYCLASLEDDFLLRHYDKGPCKNKLGHSRVSVLWHRAQVIVIFAGFGLLLAIASPLLLFVGPCLLCRSCRPCSSTSSRGSSSSRPDSEEDGNAGI